LKSAAAGLDGFSWPEGIVLGWLAWLIMQHGTICLWRLAAYVATQAQTDSVRRPP
jgi:hypothetical protein